MTTHTTIKTAHHGQLPRQWFRTVLRDYHHNGHWRLCDSSETFQLAWSNAASRDYLRKLAIRFCVNHRPNFYAGYVFLFNPNSPASDDARIAVRTAFLRWCIASTANRTA